MTEQKALAILDPSELLATDAQNQLKLMAAKLIRLTTGGNKLNQHEAADLAVYCFMTQLNPFNSEAYWMKGVGPVAGIAGYRRKAIEYMEYETGDKGHKINFDDKPATITEASFDPEKGDIAYRSTMYDSVSYEQWRQTIVKWYTDLREKGVDDDIAWERANFLAGDKPFVSAVGVVDHREHFSGVDWDDFKKKIPKKDAEGNTVYRPEMWDRHERAIKRAQKACIRKRFPSVLIPDADIDSDNIAEIVDVSVKRAIVGYLEEKIVEEDEDRKGWTEDKILADLGFETGTRIVPTVEVPEGIKVLADGAGQPEPEYVEAVPTDELPEPQTQKPNKVKKTLSSRPLTPVTLQSYLMAKAEEYTKLGRSVSDKQRGLVVGMLSACYNGNDVDRHAATNWLAGYASTRDLSDAYVLAMLDDWLGPEETETGYVPSGYAVMEAQHVLKAAMEEQGQQRMELPQKESAPDD